MSLAVVKGGVPDFYATQFAARQTAGDEPAWLTHARERAFEHFARLGFPSTRDEAWKYSNLAPLQRRQFALAPANAVFDPALVRAHDVLGGALLVFVDGRYHAALSRTQALPAGVRAGSLAAMLRSEAPHPRAAFERIEQRGTWLHSLAALNAALFTDGAYIEFPAEAEFAEPVHVLHLSTAADASAHSFNLILADAGSRAHVIEQYLQPGENGHWHNGATRIELQSGAQLRHTHLARHGGKGFYTGCTEVTLAADSRYQAHSFALGGQFYRHDIAAACQGERAHCAMNGLYVGTGREHIDFHTSIDHAAPRCESREYFKGVLDGAARAVFSGKVIVRPDAQGSDAQQSNKNLLLSEDAEIDTKPQLEIFADDVKCSHGATIGQLDENQVFYLRARGLSEAAARSLLTYAFCEEIVMQMTIPSLRKYINESLLGRLPDGDKLQELA